MLSSANHAVVGSCDLAVMQRFLAVFGFEPSAEAELPATAARKLYGLERPCRELVMAVPGSNRGWVRLVETPNRYSPPDPGEPRPLALVLETRDLESSLDRAAVVGAWCGEPSIDTARAVREATVIGPHGLRVVLRELPPDDLEASGSVLDHDGGRLVSEVTGVLWAVRSFNLVSVFWDHAAGLEILEEAQARSRPMNEVADLLDPATEMPYVRVADPQGQPVGLELLEFFDESGRHRPTWPLAMGLHAVAFAVRELDKAVERLGSAAFGEQVEVDTLVHGSARGVSGRAPGRIRLELWRELTPIAAVGSLVN